MSSCSALSNVPRGKAPDKHKTKQKSLFQIKKKKKKQTWTRDRGCVEGARDWKRAPLFFSSSLLLCSIRSFRKHNTRGKLLRDKNLPHCYVQRFRETEEESIRNHHLVFHPPSSLYFTLFFNILFSISCSFINHRSRRESAGRTRKIKWS